jgi:hypothetical protein
MNLIKDSLRKIHVFFGRKATYRAIIPLYIMLTAAGYLGLTKLQSDEQARAHAECVRRTERVNDLNLAFSELYDAFKAAADQSDNPLRLLQFVKERQAALDARFPRTTVSETC